MKLKKSMLACAVLVVAQMPWTPATADATGLPEVATGHRPGPDALYLPAADVPQLQNTGIWEADPILVSGATAYADGEFLYQDFLYDDHGAAGIPATNASYGASAHLFSPTAGTFVYPTDKAKYGNNAADLVEFRVKPLENETAFRVTLNTMLDASAFAFTIAVGDPGASVPLADDLSWPHGAGVASPAHTFITVHGPGGDVQDGDGRVLGTPTVSVDQLRRQVEVRVARDVWDPSDDVVSMSVGVGLWNNATGGYLQPAIGAATATVPGGAAPTAAAIVNIGPRTNEPYPDFTTVPTYTIGDAAVGAAQQARWWRERAQADALLLGDVSSFESEVNFASLHASVSDDSGVPKTGPLNRILASRYEVGQGLDPSKVCYAVGGANLGAKCEGRLLGALQPYAIFIPEGGAPEAGWGMALLLHSLSANQNQYSASRNQAQLSILGEGSVVVTPSGRGPDGFYAGIAEADTFETWADVARHYPLNPEQAVSSGYSMGGIGTYRMLARWPDLFSGGFSVVGAPGSSTAMLAGLRNTPIITWNALADELVNVNETETALRNLEALGLRFSSRLFLTADHLTLATNDEYAEGVAQLGDPTVDRNPRRVTFVVAPAQDSLGVTADHAYWLSDVTRRNSTIATGTIDVASGGFGSGDPTPQAVATSAGALLGGNHGPKPYLRRDLTWGPAPSSSGNWLTISARNIASVTIDSTRARVNCDAIRSIVTDGPLTVTITGCGTYQFG